MYIVFNLKFLIYTSNNLKKLKTIDLRDEEDKQISCQSLEETTVSGV